jgi:hypothetical protein
MLYCLIAALLTVFVGKFLSKSIVVLANDAAQTAQTMNVHTAFALLSRDVEQAQSELDSWRMIGSNELIFKTATGDIGWKFNQKGLYRCAGSYDFKKKRWLTVHSTPILTAVSDFSPSLRQESEHVRALEITIEMPNSKKMRNTLLLINGVKP